jgi:DNA replication protein DnaC
MSQRRRSPTPPPHPDHRQLLLDHLQTLKIGAVAQALDTLLAQADAAGWSHLEFAQRLLGDLANQRRERRIARRIADARFAEVCTLDQFDWSFNPTINRAQIEALASGDFIRRHSNWILVGQSGVGKSFLLQAVGRSACAHGFRVRYVTSAALLIDLAASLADQTLPKCLRTYTSYELLIIDEFGFDRIERREHPESTNLLYKVLDARHQKKATALATNVDFDAWGEYLGDPPLAMAFLDRLVDRSIIMKIKGKSYRASRANQPDS